ncbi:MAG TPA: deoxyguanosinetriphosphate triphosphohydrolase, partial [Candidatus Binatia bacterium]|nr:deoxyguanosinetriphosphate triphosphohydrolase [Candidatus Binatia bacterium]
MAVSRQALEAREAAGLAPYAMPSRASRGRRHPEPEHPFRMVFQRDRDRIIHSSAFRRLEYKTQVFVNHEGDYYRTRLTHTMEAAQVTRTLARALGLNEDLAEAVALAHDLGHTPFGHAGERTLDRLMQPHGGFEHNGQSLRIVETLEERYPRFRGLNLSWEVREGIVKHSTRYDRPQVAEYDASVAPCLEAQIVDFADEIAYSAHDVDDGLKSGMLDPDDLDTVPLWADAQRAVSAEAPGAPVAVLRYQAVRRLIDWMASDLVETLLARIADEHIDSLDAVRAVKPRLVEFSPDMTIRQRELKAFLYERLYTHHRVTRMTQKADRIMSALFEVYMQEPRQLPPHV